MVVTEGYGNIKMSERTYNLLKLHDGKFVSINGATQIRAGVISRRLLFPKKGEISDVIDAKERNLGMEIDSLVRVIRAPFFGKIGKVVGSSA